MLVCAVAAGEVTPEEAQAVATLLEAQRRAFETAELVVLQSLQQAVNGPSGR
jgi:hypothetical protein